MFNRIRCVVCAIAMCGAPASAESLGFQLNGKCIGGSCPAQALGFTNNANLPFGTTITLANGDVYSVTGTLTSANDASGGTLSLTYQIEAIYLGNGSGGASQTDTLTLDLFAAYQSTFGTGNFGEVLRGSFGPTIAGSSSAKICVGAVCTSTVNPPASFNVNAQFSIPPQNGGFYFDDTITAVFGAGSPVGSYILFSFPTTPAPAVFGAESASDFGGFPSVSPGSWIEIYGSNLAAGPLTWGSIDFNGVNAPTTLAGTSVTFGGQAAFVDYVSGGQVNVQVPAGVNTGTQSIVVTTAAGSSAPIGVNVNNTQPGLLAPTTFKLGGIQYVVALFPDGTYVLPPGGISNITSRRAKPGDTIILYGVGFGGVTPAIPPGQVVGQEQSNTLAGTFSISIGGTQVQLKYDGLAPNFVGLYQLNVVVPNVAASDSTPLTFSLGGTGGLQKLVIAIGN